MNADANREALATLDDALDATAATNELYYAPELERLKGVLLLRQNDPDTAALWFQKAIHTAVSQGAKSLELRAATSLARLWSEQGRPAEARDLLAPVYAWFTEGFQTMDLKDAKALLNELE